MCIVLKIPRSSYYHELEKPHTVKIDPFTDDVIRIFKANRKCYGTRRIKKELEKEDKILSRRRIGRIMKENGLVSVYTVANYKVHKSTCNNDKVLNVVDRKFDDRKVLEVVVSDLTYVRVHGKWNYVCLITDLHNREILGYSAGPNKTADLVYKAFSTIKCNLMSIKIFHTDYTEKKTMPKKVFNCSKQCISNIFFGIVFHSRNNKSSETFRMEKFIVYLLTASNIVKNDKYILKESIII